MPWAASRAMLDRGLIADKTAVIKVALPLFILYPSFSA